MLMILRPHPIEPVVFPLEGQQVTMGSGLAAKMETSELTTIIMCCVRSTYGCEVAEFGRVRHTAISIATY